MCLEMSPRSAPLHGAHRASYEVPAGVQGLVLPVLPLPSASPPAPTLDALRLCQGSPGSWGSGGVDMGTAAVQVCPWARIRVCASVCTHIYVYAFACVCANVCVRADVCTSCQHHRNLSSPRGEPWHPALSLCGSCITPQFSPAWNFLTKCFGFFFFVLKNNFHLWKSAHLFMEMNPF